MPISAAPILSAAWARLREGLPGGSMKSKRQCRKRLDGKKKVVFLQCNALCLCGTAARWHEGCSEKRRETAKRDRKRQTP